jgi:succinate dehydrogenase/fumarate reductase flavoprotein subunit
MKKESADVLVVAAGLSGLAASISAAEHGATVIAYEKANATGGAANMGMGPLGIGSRFQRRHMFTMTPGEAFRKHMNFVHYRADARLVRDYYFKSADTIDWLEEMGVAFVAVSTAFHVPERQRSYLTADQTWHVVKPADGNTEFRPGMAAAMIAAMTRRAHELGVEIRLETPVKGLIKENGRVVGVVAEDKDGQRIEARAKAVVVATGGAGDNPQMIKDYTGYEWGKDLFSIRVPGMDGDGLRMAWEAGAAKSEVMQEMIFLLPRGGADPIYFLLDGFFRQPSLWVNARGERFINEDGLFNTTFGGNLISMQPGKFVYPIFDSALLRKYKKQGADHQTHVHPPDLFDHFDEVIQGAQAAGFEHLFVADTIEELADKMGVKQESLVQTVEEYNGMCAQGYDELFEKEHKYMQPIAKGPFYACRYFPSAYGTLGGLKINHKAEVLDENDEAIPGLYAAGVDACTIYGDCYPFILPGNTMGFCLNIGRIAGENAAAGLSE